MKTIEGFENYAITSDGYVWSKPRIDTINRRRGGHWLRPGRRQTGHRAVVLCKNGQTYARLVHRLVLEAFVGPCPSGYECRHLNGDAGDNRLANLCWGTPTENQNDRKKHNTDNGGERNGNCKLSNAQVRLIKYLRNEGFIYRELSDLFNIGISQIARITKGQARTIYDNV